MIDGEVDTLVGAGIVSPSVGDVLYYEVASLPSLPQPHVIEVLADMVERRLPPSTRGIAFPHGIVNAQLGFTLARRMSLPLSILYDVEGIGHLDGPLPDEGTLSLVSYVLESAWLVREFTGLCEQRGIQVGSVVAIVDRLLDLPTPLVQSVVRVVR